MPTATFPHFSWAFVPIEPMNLRTKFEVRTITYSWDNRDTQKIMQSLNTLTRPFLQNLNGIFFSDGPCKWTRQI